VYHKTLVDENKKLISLLENQKKEREQDRQAFATEREEMTFNHESALRLAVNEQKSRVDHFE
jgi:hypothetical protein